MSDKRMDLVLKSGRVIDPANQIDQVADVGIKDGKIVEVKAFIDRSDADRVVDVSEFIVTPGLIDIHVHAYTGRLNDGPGLFTQSLNADAHFLNSGVTTCVDTGTAGADEIQHFRESVIEKAVTRILAYVNISKPGMGAPEQTISNFDVEAAGGSAKEHSDVVVGIKTAHYWTSKPFDDEHPAWQSVEKAVEAGDVCEMPVMVDFWPRPPERSYPDLILKKLRPGDIHTHVFARQFPVIDADGLVEPYMHEARERGIWFDLGHGAAFQGLPPDARNIKAHIVVFFGDLDRYGAALGPGQFAAAPQAGVRPLESFGRQYGALLDDHRLPNLQP